MSKSTFIGILIIVGLVSAVILFTQMPSVSQPSVDVGVGPTIAPDDTELLIADSCQQAGQALNDYLASQPTSCTSNSDCDAYYLRVDSCAPPVILAKSEFTRTLDSNQELLTRQAAVREACAEKHSQGPVCEPVPARPICVKGTCVDQLVAANQ